MEWSDWAQQRGQAVDKLQQLMAVSVLPQADDTRQQPRTATYTKTYALCFRAGMLCCLCAADG